MLGITAYHGEGRTIWYVTETPDPNKPEKWDILYSAHSKAEAEGYRAGKADRTLGYRSLYSWNGMVDNEASYSAQYAKGYRRAWTS